MSGKELRLCIVLAVICLLARPAQPQVAAPSGSCSVTIHRGEAIQPALRKARPGDVFCIEPGVYHEQLVISVSGSASQLIVIRGSGGRPVIDGDYVLPHENTKDLSADKLGCPGTVRASQTAVAQPMELGRFFCAGYTPLVGVYASNVILENLEITRSTGSGLAVFSETGLSNIVIRNVYVHSVRLNGIDLHKVSHAKIDHNEVSDSGNFAPFRRPGKALNWGAGIGSFGVHNVEYTANVIHHNWGDALLVDSNTGRSSDVTISNNVFYNNYSSNGVYAHAVRNVVVRGNLFYCSPNSGVFSWSSTLIAPSESSYSQDIDTTNVMVSNNVYANCPGGAVVLWDTKHGSRSVSGVAVVNNTFFRVPKPISASGGELTGLKDLKIDKNLVLDDSQAITVLVGGRNLVTPQAFHPAAADPSWFKIRKYTGTGADFPGSGKAGLF